MTPEESAEIEGIRDRHDEADAMERERFDHLDLQTTEAEEFGPSLIMKVEVQFLYGDGSLHEVETASLAGGPLRLKGSPTRPPAS